MALREAFSMQFARKNTGAAEDTARKIGKRGEAGVDYRSSFSDIIPLRFSGILLFALSPWRAGIEVVAAKPTLGPIQAGMAFIIPPVAQVIFSACVISEMFVRP